MAHKIVQLNDTLLVQLASKTNHSMLVNFAAQDCSPCEAFKEEFQRFAELDSLLDMVAEIDALKYQDFITDSGLQLFGFPTQVLFINTLLYYYTGPRTAESLLAFIHQKLRPLTVLRSEQDARKIVEKGTGFRCFFGMKNISETESIIEKITNISQYQFFGVENKIFDKIFPASDSIFKIAVMNDVNKNASIYQSKNFSQDALLEFLDKNLLSLVNDINENIIGEMFRSSSNYLLLFFNSSKELSPILASTFLESTRKIRILAKDTISFVSIDCQSTEGDKAIKLFGIDTEKLPIIEIIYIKKKQFFQYLFEDDPLNVRDLVSFYERWIAGEIPRYYKSEAEPSSNPGPVYKLVGKNFKKEVLDNKLDVLVRVYTPYCHQCWELAEISSKLAKLMEKLNPSLVFYEMDGTRNDSPELIWDGYSKLILYPGNRKSRPVQYNGEGSLQNLAEFLERYSSNPVLIPELEATEDMHDEL